MELVKNAGKKLGIFLTGATIIGSLLISGCNKDRIYSFRDSPIQAETYNEVEKTEFNDLDIALNGVQTAKEMEKYIQSSAVYFDVLSTDLNESQRRELEGEFCREEIKDLESGLRLKGSPINYFNGSNIIHFEDVRSAGIEYLSRPNEALGRRLKEEKVKKMKGRMKSLGMTPESFILEDSSPMEDCLNESRYSRSCPSSKFSVQREIRSEVCGSNTAEARKSCYDQTDEAYLQFLRKCSQDSGGSHGRHGRPDPIDEDYSHLTGLRDNLLMQAGEQNGERWSCGKYKGSKRFKINPESDTRALKYVWAEDGNTPPLNGN